MGPKCCLGLSCEVTLGAGAWVIQGCNSSTPQTRPRFTTLCSYVCLAMAGGCTSWELPFNKGYCMPGTAPFPHVTTFILPVEQLLVSSLWGQGHWASEWSDFPKLPQLGGGRTRTETQVSLVPTPLLLLNLLPSLVPRSLVWHFNKGLY